MECPSNGDVPADIIRDILLRLPVKILSHCKCVCKEWYTLIESTSFVNEHFVCERNQERVLVFKPVHRHGLNSDFFDYHYLGKWDGVMGLVNGILCVVNKSGDVCLLNPALRQFKPLPFLSSNANPVAFGLDPLSGYYKIVSIQTLKKIHFYFSICPPPIVHVYSSGSDSWRLLENVDMLRPLEFAFRSKSSTYLNGVYYWVMMNRNFDYDVLAFDMSSDKFRIIRIPDVIKHRSSGLKLELFVYGDSIVILSFIYSLFCKVKFVDMWVLENDGMWAKRSTFGPFRDMISPLGFWKSNELMLETITTHLTLYNIFTRELRCVEARGKPSDPIEIFPHWICTYKESLVSIKEEGGGDNCKLQNISSSFVVDFSGGLIRIMIDQRYWRNILFLSG